MNTISSLTGRTTKRCLSSETLPLICDLDNTVSRESVALISDLENLITSRSDGTVGRLSDNLGLHLVGILLVDHLHIIIYKKLYQEYSTQILKHIRFCKVNSICMAEVITKTPKS